MLSERPRAAKDLNLTRHEQFKALLALAFPALLLAGLASSIFILLAAVAAATYIIANREFFAFLFRRLPLGSFLVGVMMHWCYHCYSPLTYALTMIQLRLARMAAAISANFGAAARPRGTSASNH
jgi:hypothetical protein